MSDDREDELQPKPLEEVKRTRTTPMPSPIKQEPGAMRQADTHARENGARRSSTHTADNHPRSQTPASTSQSPTKRASSRDSPAPKLEEEMVGGDVSLVQEPGQPPKLSRTASKKIPSRPPQLFVDVPDATSEAQRGYDTIDSCSYANKYLGTTDHAMECECSEEWGKPHAALAVSQLRN